MSPESTASLKEKMLRIISRYPRKEAALLPLLHLAQREFGYISTLEEKMIADILGIKPIRVREAVTFYTMLNRKPLGKYHIQVCTNITCSLLGAERLIDYLKERLKIEVGETTPDKKFTLSEVECLGACEQAPSMMINFDYYGNLDKKKIDDILKSLE